MNTVKKLAAKFDVFRLRRSLLEPVFDVNQSLHVETAGMHNSSASSFDLHACDCVRLLEKLATLRCKLASLRGILLNPVDDHVKHAFDHVKLSPKLPCSNAITSDFGSNFLA